MPRVITTTTTTDTAAGTNTDITGASFAVAAGRQYWFQADFLWDIVAATDGAQFIVDVPATPTRLGFKAQHAATASTDTILNSNADGGEVSETTAPATTGNVTRIFGFVKPSAAGEVKFQVDCEGGGDVTVQPSMIEYYDMGAI